MSLTPPLYCALCSARCLVPRIELPLPAPRPGGLSLNTDTVGSQPPSPGMKHDPSTWEKRWFVLQVSNGLIQPPLASQIHSEPTSPLGSGPSTDSTVSRMNQRCVPIHAYCLTCVLGTVRRSMYNNGFSHEENMILAWSIPKWTGHGDWTYPSDLEPSRSPTGSFSRLRSAYWSGTESQRRRWDPEIEGSHLLPEDMVSPEEVGTPKSILPDRNASRLPQASLLLAIPEHILRNIALELVNVPHDENETIKRNTASRLLPMNDITDLLSFTRTCADCRYLTLPAWLWIRILSDAVARFKLSLLSRWRANPTGVGSTMQLAISLDEAFTAPVEEAVSHLAWDLDDVAGWDDDKHRRTPITARDLFFWWSYSDSWKSRRRIWYTVVHACATARDADWW
ncbi:hypothetical protein BD324DRAFT_650025 [Kockovaella imperatae]|uniref:Uncharacterized protein n=1 Tax=Kockovaella imperatae TaxID=4999 RepID=A0A1Y1UKU7_9TREE|nr:hypothetical protein BD324DRAFT_650025 [Kockovaella imperatae]ORX38678.1 hypothetical protein BD324DRAFT_650025 [Kockovaella imperatae]